MSRDMRETVEEGYDRGDYPGRFRVEANPNERERQFLDQFIKEVGTEGEVLDLGCGTGIPFDRYLVDSGAKVTGVDISQKHIDLAKRNVPDGTFIKADFSRHDFGDQHFDGVLAVYSIFHLPRNEHRALFAKIASLLRSDGVLLMTTVGGEGEEYGEEKDWAGAPMAWSSFGPDEYRKILGEQGFTIIREEFEGKQGDEEFHLWILARKSKGPSPEASVSSVPPVSGSADR